MGRTMIWAVAAVFGLTVAFPAGMAGQALGPTDSDLYCAGYFTQRALGTGMEVLGGEDGGFKNEFGDRDIIYLTRGQGAAPGTLVEIESPVDSSPTTPTLTCTGDPAQVEAGQPVRLSAMGVSATGAPFEAATSYPPRFRAIGRRLFHNRIVEECAVTQPELRIDLRIL